jgi:Flp pilus assembly protein TadG
MRTEATPASPPLASWRNRRGQRGNAMIEMAMVFLPLFAILIGIFDFSMAIFLKSTFQHAVREGVRYAVTYNIQPGMGHDASIKSVVQTNAMGFLSGSEGLDKIHIQYFDGFTFQPTQSNAPLNLIEVSIEGYEWGWVAPISGSMLAGREYRRATPLTLAARAADRMESLPTGFLPPAR